VVQALAEGHAARGRHVSIAAVMGGDDPDHPFLSGLRRSGVPVTVLPFPGRRYLRERSALARLLRERRPDVVHTHGYRADVLGGTVAAGLGLPVVTTVHGFTGGDWKNRIFERVQTRAFRRFSVVVAVSRPLVERLVRCGVPRARVRMLRNAWRSAGEPLEKLEARQSLGLDPDAFTIGWVGRLSREKGPDLFLDALERMRDESWQAVVVGDGRDRAALTARAARLSAGDRIRWAGMVPDAARYLPAFDLLVLSSRTEGTPIVLFEAMAAGVPLVAAAVGGVPDVLSAAEARLVPPEDPSALADAMRDTIRLPDSAAERANRALRRLADEFAAEPWLDAYEEVYRSAARQNGPR
jgi:glycosyltransferase involved in cell wall biosynthesis